MQVRSRLIGDSDQRLPLLSRELSESNQSADSLREFRICLRSRSQSAKLLHKLTKFLAKELAFGVVITKASE